VDGPKEKVEVDFQNFTTWTQNLIFERKDCIWSVDVQNWSQPNEGAKSDVKMREIQMRSREHSSEKDSGDNHSCNILPVTKNLRRSVQTLSDRVLRTFPFPGQDSYEPRSLFRAAN
jgi:hypothetical protein